MLSVRFWGVRGSIPCPGPDTVVYGGNTACIEIRADDRLIIVDLGTGARTLGNKLIETDLKKFGKISADIFITHTHWDHIMGFPMFGPIYVPKTELRITGPVSLENENIKSIIENQLSYKYWPVSAEELAAKIEYNMIKETTLDLGDGITVTSKFLNHPAFCLGYRFTYQGKSIAAVFDHEPFRSLVITDKNSYGYDEQADKNSEITAEKENEKIASFIKGADLLIHDAQYLHEEYLKHIGWGHGSYDHAIKTALASGAKKLIFFHHEPSHTDSQLDELEKSYANNSDIQILMAKEGMCLEV